MNYYDSINSSKRATGMIKSLFGPNECVTFPKSKQMFLNEPFTDPLILEQSFNTVVSAGNSRIEFKQCNLCTMEGSPEQYRRTVGGPNAL